MVHLKKEFPETDAQTHADSVKQLLVAQTSNTSNLYMSQISPHDIQSLPCKQQFNDFRFWS